MKHRITLGALAAAVLLAYAPVHANAAAAKPAALEKAPAKSNEAAKKQFWALADEYYDAIAKFDPVGATQNGDNRFDDQLGTAIWPESRAKQFDPVPKFEYQGRVYENTPRAQLVNAPQLYGYTVFGKVVSGMDVVNRIKSVPTGAGGPFPSDAPKTPVLIKSATLVN